MRHQMGEDKKRKKEQKQAETGFEKWSLWAKAVEDDDIDPADFFDTEEFGYRRRGSDASRP
jgi:hypothetical protein